jgi:uncharacterized protein (UPF0179 family)
VTDGHRQKVDQTTQVDRTEVHRTEVHGAQVDRTQVDEKEVAGTQVDRTQVDGTQVDKKKEVGCEEVDDTQIDGEASLNARPSARSREGAIGPLSASPGVDEAGHEQVRATLPRRVRRALP